MAHVLVTEKWGSVAHISLTGLWPMGIRQLVLGDPVQLDALYASMTNRS